MLAFNNEQTLECLGSGIQVAFNNEQTLECLDSGFLMDLVVTDLVVTTGLNSFVNTS